MDDWKMVPVEPTPEMVAAMAKAWQDAVAADDPDECVAEYRAAMSAAPAPPPHWTPVAAGLPALGMPVWLYEPGRGIWVGARADTGDGWLWGNTYGSHYYAETTGGAGAWQCFDNDDGDDYGPTFWMPLPEAPTPNV